MADPKILVEYQDHYAKKRIYAQEVSSDRYTLTEERRLRLDSVPRVIHTNAHGADYGEWTIIDPGPGAVPDAESAVALRHSPAWRAQ